MSTPMLSPPPSSGNAALIDAALTYAARGWSIIAVICKKAAGLWKPFQERPADETTLRKTFAKPGISGLAVVLGRVSSGLACRDFDREGAYESWAAANPDEANVLPTVRTSRGYHVYFRGPEGFTNLGDGEYRADTGHYCLLPPSRHPNGTTYTWLVPLPDGELPIIDSRTSGLLSVASRTSETQDTQHTQDTHATQVTHPHTLHVSDIVVQTIITDTLPTAPGQRNHRLFDLARALKAIVPDAARHDLRVIVQDWHRQAFNFIRTKDFTTSWADFTLAWNRVKVPKGAAFGAALATADANPIPAAALAYDLPAMQRLVALCAALQAHHGPGRAWPLSCRLAGKTVGVGHDTAARWLKLLIADGVLELIASGGPKGSEKAAEYRYAE